jgi:hypothetical protein
MGYVPMGLTTKTKQAVTGETLPHAGPHRQGGVDHVVLLRDVFDLARGDA